MKIHTLTTTDCRNMDWLRQRGWKVVAHWNGKAWTFNLGKPL